MSSRRYAAPFALLALVTLGACQKKEPEPPAPAKSVADEAAKKSAAAPAAARAGCGTGAAAAQPNPERNAYFGETHLHTSWSVDAWVMGNRLTGPADAYKYAQGETIKHPMGFDIKIDTPLDFMGVTDHSEYVGVTKQANTPGSYVSTLPAAQPMIMKDPTSQDEQNRVFSYLLKLNSGAPVKALMDPKITATVWKENVQIADEQNKPGQFTAFCSYEWTSMPDNRNMHRNVFFRDCAKVPDYPFSSLESTRPTDLWSWMDAQRKAATICSPSRTTPTSATAGCSRSTSTRPPGGRSTPPGRPHATATSASPRSSRARGNRKRTRCCRPTTSSPTTSCSRPFSACRPTSAASTASRAATCARRSRTASRCRTRAATTRTSSAWPAVPTRTTAPARTARTTSSACTPMPTARSSGALPAC